MKSVEYSIFLLIMMIRIIRIRLQSTLDMTLGFHFSVKHWILSAEIDVLRCSFHMFGVSWPGTPAWRTWLSSYPFLGPCSWEKVSSASLKPPPVLHHCTMMHSFVIIIVRIKWLGVIASMDRKLGKKYSNLSLLKEIVLEEFITKLGCLEPFFYLPFWHPIANMLLMHYSFSLFENQSPRSPLTSSYQTYPQ